MLTARKVEIYPSIASKSHIKLRWISDWDDLWFRLGRIVFTRTATSGIGCTGVWPIGSRFHLCIAWLHISLLEARQMPSGYTPMCLPLPLHSLELWLAATSWSSQTIRVNEFHWQRPSYQAFRYCADVFKAANVVVSCRSSHSSPRERPAVWRPCWIYPPRYSWAAYLPSTRLSM